LDSTSSEQGKGDPRGKDHKLLTTTSASTKKTGNEESPSGRWEFGTHWGKEPHPALAAFSSWAQRYLAKDQADRNTMVSEGIELAQNRRTALLELIKTDPREALASSVPFAVRQQMPAAVSAQLEQRISGKGSLEVLATVPREGALGDQPAIIRSALIGQERFTAHVFGERKNQRTTSGISLHGVAIEGQVALSESPIRVLEPGEPLPAGATNAEPICSVSGLATGSAGNPPTGGAVLAASGDQAHWLCRGGHLEGLEYKVRAAEGGATAQDGAIAATYGSTGTRKIMVMMIDFADVPGGAVSQATALESLNDVTAFIRSNAFNQVNFTVKDVTPVLRMPQTAAYYVNSNAWSQLLLDARNAADQAGFHPTQYDFEVVAFGNIGFPWGGLGYVGAKGSWVQGNFHRGVTAHELGHNLGNWHANSWVSSSITGTNGTHSEYGNPFDVLGNAYNYPRNHYNANFKFLNGWLISANIHTVTASGVYRIYAHDMGGNLDAARKYAIRIPVSIAVGDETEDYWIDFRQGCTGNAAAANGAIIKWGNDSGTVSASRLLDTQPGTLGNMEDAPLLVGSTFYDSSRLLSITTMTKGGAGVNAYLDIQISFGSLPPVTLSEALDLPGASWNTGGDQAWVGERTETYDAASAASSGVIGNSQQSFVETTVIGPGTVTFWWKVSSESGYDFLSFLTDGLTLDAISGEQPWQKRTNFISAGFHTLRWKYSKDSSVATGGDQGWIDQITFTPRPGNDMFGDSTIIPSWTSTAVGSNIGATKESGEPFHAGNVGGRSVWWTWTAPLTGPVTISTAGSPFDTLLGVYTGSSLATLTLIGANDDSGGTLTSTVGFAASAGTTYRIAVDGYNGASSNIWLTISNPPPANDMFANSITIPNTISTVAGHNLGATKEPGEPNHAGVGGGKSVWWTWTAPADGMMRVSTEGSSYDTTLAVYTGSSVSSLGLVASNDDSGGFLTSAVRFIARAGATYQVAVDGFGGSSGRITLTILPVAPLRLSSPQRSPDGGCRILITSADNAPLDPSRLQFIDIYANSSISQPMTAWTRLPGLFTAQNGGVWIEDPDARYHETRFYRASERTQ